MSRHPNGTIEREVEAEIRFHIEARTAANIAAGMHRQAARRDALRRFGNRDRVRRAGQEILAGAAPARDGASLITTLAQDIRFGARMLGRNPLAAAAAILSLGLGIGVNTATFSTVYGVLFRELPFEGGDRLLFVDAWNPDRGDGDAPITWADLEALRGLEPIEAAGAFTNRNYTLTGLEHPERVAGAAVTPGLFRMLGVQPQIGRLFDADEGAEAGFEDVALLSDGLWRRMFGGDRAVVGRSIILNDRELVVIGVLPPDFRFPEREDLWLPLGTDTPNDHQRRYIRGAALLRSRDGLATTQQLVAQWSEDAAAMYPDTHVGWTVRALWFRHGFIDAPARQLLYLMLGAVGFVLLLACANVANLLLAQGAERRRELVVRSALGASRARIVRQMLTESVLLGLCGGAIGIAIALAWVRAQGSAIPEEMAFWISLAVDRAVLGYALAVSIGTGLVFGLLPALQASSSHLAEELRNSGRGLSEAGHRGRLRAALVIGEVALSIVLLVSAALMVGSFLQLQDADPGFDSTPLLSLRISLAGDQYDEPAARAEFYRQAIDRLSALPGVVSVAATGAIPADDGGSAVTVLPEGRATDDEGFYATATIVTHGLFATLDTALLAGRELTLAEAIDPEARVAVIGTGLARRLWPGEDPLDRTVEIASGVYRVIGVAPDLQYEEFGEDTASSRLQLHLPYARGSWRGMAMLIRTTGDPASLIGPMRETLAIIDPLQAPFDILTMPQRRSFTTWPQRLFGNSFAAFGVIALALALCGVYGVVAYSVSRRTQEMGVRIALGARPIDVQRQVVLSAVRLAATGAALGIVGAVIFARALSGALYGVSSTDPRVFVAVAVLLIVAAALASWIPARRAARVDPTEALRAD